MLCSALLAVQKVYGEIWKQVSNWRLCSVWPNPSLHRESLNCWRSLPPGWSTQLIVLHLSPYRCVFDNVETVTISFSLCSPFVWQRNCLSWMREENSCSDFFFFFSEFHSDLIPPAVLISVIDRDYVYSWVTSGHVGNLPEYGKVFLSLEDRILLSWFQHGQERLCSTLPKRVKCWVRQTCFSTLALKFNSQLKLHLFFWQGRFQRELSINTPLILVYPRYFTVGGHWKTLWFRIIADIQEVE